ncbi:hypothetical protein JRQ81_009893 [Phrynocephalus forsythii]|uniref:Uncharacterized protein n=1 Tax=Phrynocephalus forsythii TaxID=171643 RepID=A0A9Q1AS44_9SAUR|nr:hypothetical protein JRQ81_009893 [Phrynocephalus forsythii]
MRLTPEKESETKPTFASQRPIEESDSVRKRQVAQELRMGRAAGIPVEDHPTPPHHHPPPLPPSGCLLGGLCDPFLTLGCEKELRPEGPGSSSPRRVLFKRCVWKPFL